MRCLYREHKFICGDYMDVDIYPVFKSGDGRQKKAKPSTETQALLNSRNAEKKLTRLAHCNFTSKDLEIHLTYAINPSTEEEARKDLQNFLRRVKRMRKKAGLPALKYIAVTERGKRDTCRYHHHITMSGGLDRDALEECWGKGTANSRRLQFNEYGIAGLMHYITKDSAFDKDSSVFKKRWLASKNLNRPVERTSDYKYSSRKVKELAKERENRRFIEQHYKGYFCADCSVQENPYNNGTYLSIRLYRTEARIQ